MKEVAMPLRTLALLVPTAPPPYASYWGEGARP